MVLNSSLFSLKRVATGQHYFGLAADLPFHGAGQRCRVKLDSLDGSPLL